MAIIDKPSDYFNTVLYTGNGSRTINNRSRVFSRIFMVKGRTSTSSHRLWYIIRGTNKQLSSNALDAEETISTVVSSYDSDGFTVGADNGSNESGQTYVAWNWKANGSGVSNTSGSITSTVSANTTSGFSVITFTGDGNANATVGHGLGVAPKMVIVKSRSDAYGWFVYHASLTTGDNIYLNDTGAAFGGSYVFDVTSTVFKLRDHIAVNGDGVTFVAYCFAEKQGYSKFGSYTGNGNADGAFVYTGFKPAFVILKATSVASQNWMMFDNKRNEFNVMNKKLYADNKSC
jgi:hypothetical protein